MARFMLARKFMFLRRLARRRVLCLLGILSLGTVWFVMEYLETKYIKIDNADFPNIGDFSCDHSLKKTSCTFASNQRNLETFGIKKCNAFGELCKGFVVNQGMKTVTLKQTFYGKNTFAVGMTLFLRKTHASLVNITGMFEVCADSLENDANNLADTEKKRCNLPNLDPFDKSILGVMFKPERFTCHGGKDLTFYENGTLRINPQIKGVISKVEWQVVKVKPGDGSQFILSSSGILSKKKPTVAINEDMIRVDVTTQDGRRQTDFHLKISPKPDVLKRPKKKGLSSINVMMLGVDSTAHSHFQRKLGKVYNYLKDDLKSFIFNGYSIVGDGTTPALLALLTGRKEEELPEGRHRMPGAKCLDDWPWVFKEFQKNGYATMFNEDEVDLGAFTYRLMGFCNPPMDHYLLPYWFAGIKAVTPWFKVGMGSLKGHCIGSQAIHNVSLEMVRSMYEAYPKTPKFGMSFFSDICHSRLNDLSLLEDDFLRFLKEMKERRYLDNTILVTFGDHGIRFGSIRSTVIGKMEERLPFLSITLPSWFEQNYPELASNLRRNIDVLSSPLDVHATFRHILSYPSVPPSVGYGRSLFTNLGERICKETGIPTHFCPCMEWKRVDINHNHIKNSAVAILDHINGLIKKENLIGKCALLTLKEIKSAVKVTPNEDVETFDHSADQDGRKALKGEKPKGVCHYQLQIATMPNNGIFEATVQLSSASVIVNKQMSRIDRYGDQPKCIVETHHHMREYCYCRQ